MTTRREFISGIGAMGGAVLLAQQGLAQNPGQPPEPVPPPADMPPEHVGEYTLPPLPYATDALEPYIDKLTMEIHHGKHHAGYVKGLNEALKGMADARNSGNFDAMQALSRKLAFNAGGYFNHNVFWKNMAPAGKGGGGKPSGKLAAQIDKDLGNFDKFKAHFSAAAGSVEGNGWGVLAWHDGLQRLVVLAMMNQQNQMPAGTEPLLMCDVWEHAYYVKYQNRRADYINAWWNIVNWKDVEERFGKAM